METLYVYVSHDKRYIGYVKINMIIAKLTEGKCMNDIRTFAVRNGFVNCELRSLLSKMKKFTLVGSKEW